VSELAARLRDLFVAPAGTAPAGPAVAPRVPPSVAVLGRPADVSAAAPVLALALARQRGDAGALVCIWGAPDSASGPRLPARAAVRRLADRLAAEGLAARATGPLALVTLPADPAAAAAAAVRAAAASPLPVVIALCGARTGALDRLLAEQDAIAVIAPPRGEGETLARLACSGLAGLPVPALTCRLRINRLSRALACAGLAMPAAARESVAPVLEAVS